MTQYRPTGNFIIIAPDVIPERTESGLFIPEQSRKNANEGRVFDVGPDVRSVTPGDRVVFTEYSPYRLKDDGVEICVVAESNIILYKPQAEATYPPMSEAGQELR